MHAPKLAIVIGAGFAGLKAAKALANHEGLRVILVDHRNHHLFQPLLYQVATAGLNPSDIAVPIRVQFRGAANVEIHLGHVDAADLKKQMDGLNTKDQGKFASGLSEVSDEMKDVVSQRKSALDALKKLEASGDTKQALLGQEGCKQATASASATDS